MSHCPTHDNTHTILTHALPLSPLCTSSLPSSFIKHHQIYIQPTSTNAAPPNNLLSYPVPPPSIPPLLPLPATATTTNCTIWTQVSQHVYHSFPIDILHYCLNLITLVPHHCAGALPLETCKPHFSEGSAQAGGGGWPLRSHFKPGVGWCILNPMWPHIHLSRWKCWLQNLGLSMLRGKEHKTEPQMLRAPGKIARC